MMLMNAVQRWLIASIVFVSIVSTLRVQLLSLGNLPGVPLEFYNLTLSFADLLLIALLLLTALRVITSAPYRARLWATCQLLWQRQSLLAWVLLVTWMALSAFWALEPTLTRFVTLHAAACVGLALITADTVRAEGYQHFHAALIFSALLQLILAVAQVLNGNVVGLSALGEIPPDMNPTLLYYRPPGLSHNPNYLGGYFMLALAAALMLFVRVGQERRRWWFMLAAALCTFGLVLTLSRSTFVGLAVAAAPLLILAFRRASPRRRAHAIIALLVLMLVALLVAAVAARGSLGERIFGARPFFFEDAWRVIQANPLLGSGAGNLMYTISLRLGVIAKYVLPVHIVYVYVWAEAGLVGLALFLTACGTAFRGWRPLRSTTSFDMERLLWGSVLIGVLVTMLFDNYWWAIHPFRVLFFWAFGVWYGLGLRDAPAVPSFESS